MNSRNKWILERFEKAKKYLGEGEVVSVKFRGSTPYSDYKELLRFMEGQNLRIQSESLPKEFGERGWTVKGGAGSKVIIVEHETGLEILYIAGSIASLISTIPVIVSAWKRINFGFRRHRDPFDDYEALEIRKLDNKKGLIEVPAVSIEGHIYTELYGEITGLRKQIAQLEKKLEKQLRPQKQKKSKTRR